MCCIVLMDEVLCVVCWSVCVMTVMGHVVYNTMKLIGLSKTPRVDVNLRQSLDELNELTTKSPHLTDRELLHVKALHQFADGYRTIVTSVN